MLPRLPRPALLLAAPLLGTLVGCSSGGGVQRVSTPMLPAPSQGTAWQMTTPGAGGTYGETSPDTSPWITIGGDGSVNARIPPSAATQQAATAVQQGQVSSLQIRRAP